MDLHYNTKIVTKFKGNPFITVELPYFEVRPYIANLLHSLASVRSVNFSKENRYDLIVYPTLGWKLDEVDMEVRSALCFGLSDVALRSEFSGIKIIILDDYPNCKKHLELGIKRIKEDSEYREGLDEMRVSLELLCKEILNSNASLENLKEEILAYLSKRGLAKEICNFYATCLNSYVRYNNNNVKHSDGNRISRREAMLIMKTITALMAFLIDRE